MSRVKKVTIGMKFGRLTVLDEAEGRHGKRRWWVQCACGSPAYATYTQGLIRTTGKSIRGCNECKYDLRPSQTLSLSIVEERIKVAHGDEVKIIASTYMGIGAEADFRDSEFGNFTRIVAEVTSLGKRHPKYGIRKASEERKYTAAEIQQTLNDLLNGKVRIDQASYKGLTESCRFIDTEFGDYWRTPQYVVSARRRHPFFHHQEKFIKENKAFIDKTFGIYIVDARIWNDTESQTGENARWAVRCTRCDQIFEKSKAQLKSYVTACVCIKAEIARGNGKVAKNQEKILPLATVQQRIREAHGDTVAIVPSSYVSASKQATFTDITYGDWDVIPLDVIGGHGHSDRGLAARTALRKTPPEELIKRILSKHGSQVKILIETYVNQLTDATFVDEDFGKFHAYPAAVLNGVSHPSRQQEKTRATYMKRYGVPHNMQSREGARANALAQNNITLIPHWKTGEILICKASYERAVVNWFNANKINFNWQPNPIALPFPEFKTPKGKECFYHVDCYVIDWDLWVEVKGFIRDDFAPKWEWFIKNYPNSELWTREVLLEKGILI